MAEIYLDNGAISSKFFHNKLQVNEYQIEHLSGYLNITRYWKLINK